MKNQEEKRGGSMKDVKKDILRRQIELLEKKCEYLEQTIHAQKSELDKWDDIGSRIVMISEMLEGAKNKKILRAVAKLRKHSPLLVANIEHVVESVKDHVDFVSDYLD
jgi:hypothetical protein